MHEDGEYSDGRNSDNSSQSSGTHSSRMRRATYPIDNEDVPSQSGSSQGSSPRSSSPHRVSESHKRPPFPPASPPQQSPLSPLARSFGFCFQNKSQQANPACLSGGQARTNLSGNLDAQQQDKLEDDRPYQSSSAQQIRDRRKSVDDGFNSDPEQSSRAMRLQATHAAHSESTNGSTSGTPRHKGGIRRAASDAQLVSRYASRAGTGQRLGSFGSHTSDSTYSFDDYLRNHRSPSPSPKSRRAFVVCICHALFAVLGKSG